MKMRDLINLIEARFAPSGTPFAGLADDLTGWLLSVPSPRGGMAYGHTVATDHYLYSDEAAARSDYATARKAFGRRALILLRQYSNGKVIASTHS